MDIDNRNNDNSSGKAPTKIITNYDGKSKEDYDKAFVENERLLKEWEELVEQTQMLNLDEITKDIIAKHVYYKKTLQENISWMAKFIKAVSNL